MAKKVNPRVLRERRYLGHTEMMSKVWEGFRSLRPSVAPCLLTENVLDEFRIVLRVRSFQKENGKFLPVLRKWQMLSPWSGLALCRTTILITT